MLPRSKRCTPSSRTSAPKHLACSLKAINAEVAALIPSSLAKEFDSAEIVDFRCANAPLEHLTPGALASVTKECMAGWITNSTLRRSRLGARKSTKLPGNIFSDIPAGDHNAFKESWLRTI